MSDYEELNFLEMPKPGVARWAVRWACVQGDVAPHNGTSYDLGSDGCSGKLADTFYFSVDGDVLTIYWSTGTRQYKHAPEVPKRPEDPFL